MCVHTWISIPVDVVASTQGVAEASRHVAGGPLSLQDLQT